MKNNLKDVAFFCKINHFFDSLLILKIDLTLNAQKTFSHSYKAEACKDELKKNYLSVIEFLSLVLWNKYLNQWLCTHSKSIGGIGIKIFDCWTDNIQLLFEGVLGNNIKINIINQQK